MCCPETYIYITHSGRELFWINWHWKIFKTWSERRRTIKVLGGGGAPHSNQTVRHIIGKLSKFYSLCSNFDFVTVWGISIFEKMRKPLLRFLDPRVFVSFIFRWPRPNLIDYGVELAFFLSFFLYWVADARLNHWTKRMGSVFFFPSWVAKSQLNH